MSLECRDCPTRANIPVSGRPSTSIVRTVCHAARVHSRTAVSGVVPVGRPVTAATSRLAALDCLVEHQILLDHEVVEDGLAPHVGRTRDVVDSDGVEAMRGEQRSGRGRDRLVRSCDDPPDQANSSPMADALASHGIVRGHAPAAARLLRERLAEPWTLSSLAEEVHLSRSQLVRAFDATVQTSPMAYLRHMRVERMARLPASTDLSIAETARSVGWADPNYASRCFHQHFGASPTEFRHRQPKPPPVG